MKQLLCVLITIAFVACAQARKVKVTIDGTMVSSDTRIYLIVNEDTANAQILPIDNHQFSVTVTVDRNAFIRLHDYKEWPERSAFVLIPDSRHIAINWNSGDIRGSRQSQKLKNACKEIKDASPEGFHIDVFSENPEDWHRAQEHEQALREGMLMEQKRVFEQQMRANKNNYICAWLVYCFPQLLEGETGAMLEQTKPKPKWMNHPILKAKQ